jgi:epoxyqueuosine reductase
MTPDTEHELLPLAKRAGLAAVGIARCTPSETYPIYTSWLASGYAAGMTYLHTRAPQRADPRHVAPETRSIIAAALRYPRHPAPGTGFSSCAWGRDYHTVMRDKLKPLADFLHAHCNAKVTRICVDSAPLLEREWAARAGIGWRGRQGQIVNPKLGCCLVLGFILTDADLAPSQPMPNRCGSCRRCLEACPTGALQPNGLVDARRCTAYLTIEHREALSPEQQRTIGTAIFGCDACTAVCPWNRFGEDQICPELALHHRPTDLDCTRLDKPAFNAMFRDTSVARTTLPRLQRNAAIAIANRAAIAPAGAQGSRAANAI